MKYDSSVIVAFAEALFAQAETIVLTYTIVGTIVGAGVGWAVSSRLPDGMNGFFILIGGVVVAVAALALGRQKAFALRLQAQVALCQVQIEANTQASLARG